MPVKYQNCLNLMSKIKLYTIYIYMYLYMQLFEPNDNYEW